MSDIDPVRFVLAWDLWDERSGDSYRAGKFEDACQELARDLGASATQIRAELADYVRVEPNKRKALKAVLAKYQREAA